MARIFSPHSSQSWVSGQHANQYLTGGGLARMCAQSIIGPPPFHPSIADETGAPVLYVTGRNFEYRACARVTSPDQRWLRFLVSGTRPANAIMTAVDHAGNRVARYRFGLSDEFAYPLTPDEWRLVSGPVEITLHPDRALSDELALAIAISVPWLDSYFHTESRAWS